MSAQGSPAEYVRPCDPCRWAHEDAATVICDHTEVEVRLAMALAAWVMDDDEADEQEAVERAAGFLDTGDHEDVRRILSFVEHDENTQFTVESKPEFDTEGGQGFAVNGVAFAIEYEAEGSGVVQPAATWRPECVICGEPVRAIRDEMCATCDDEGGGE